MACALVQLPALLSEDHAALTAELTGSRAAAAESRAAAAALHADLKAADVTTASLRKQLKEAEVLHLHPAFPDCERLMSLFQDRTEFS